MAASKLIGVRFPEHLLTEVEKFGLENFPEKGEWNKTNTILHLIQKGLQSEGVDVVQNVKQGVNIEQIKKLIDDRITNETQKKINSIREEQNEQLEQFISDQNELMGKLCDRIEKLESMATQTAVEEEAIALSTTDEAVEAPTIEEDAVDGDVEGDQGKKGLTAWQLAKKLGIAESTVRGWRDRGNFSSRGRYAYLKEEWEIREGKFYPK